MMKLRKNLLVAMIAGMLAFAGVACEEGVEDDPATDPGMDPGTTETDPGLDDDPLEDDPLDS